MTITGIHVDVVVNLHLVQVTKNVLLLAITQNAEPREAPRECVRVVVGEAGAIEDTERGKRRAAGRNGLDCLVGGL